MMEWLLKTQPVDESFTARPTTLKEMIQHHVDEEEEDLFPTVEKRMDAGELKTLGDQMEKRFEKMKGEGFRPRHRRERTADAGRRALNDLLRVTKPASPAS
jgi:hemerythrin-like domain-containing protein